MLSSFRAVRPVGTNGCLIIDVNQTLSDSPAYSSNLIINYCSKSEAKEIQTKNEMVSMTFRYQDLNNPLLALIFSMHRTDTDKFVINIYGPGQSSKFLSFTYTSTLDENITSDIATVANETIKWMGEPKERTLDHSKATAELLGSLFGALSIVNEHNNEKMNFALRFIPTILRSGLNLMKKSKPFVPIAPQIATPITPVIPPAVTHIEPSEKFIKKRCSDLTDTILDTLIGGVIGGVSTNYAVTFTNPQSIEATMILGLGATAGACAIPLLKWLIRECASHCCASFFSPPKEYSRDESKHAPQSLRKTY